ncbi:DUF2304 domain-containing protein [Xylanimonas sp. McL0601]|uniref:DUF2304 domain-containing protein n=1 Tax=Xylanimonas sp. McL0601 TaxID=3414739 RepID=UPI003CF24A55
MSGYAFAVALCLLVVVSLVQLLRRRWIREKYAGIWIIVALGIAVLGAFPGLAVHVARLVGVEIPANLVFATAVVTLLAVCIQLSVGVSQLDERVRTLTEEVALLRLEVRRPTAPASSTPSTPSADEA